MPELSWTDWLIYVLISVGRLSAIVLFIKMLWHPQAYNTRWKFVIVLLVVVAFLPIPGGNLRRRLR